MSSEIGVKVEGSLIAEDMVSESSVGIYSNSSHQPKLDIVATAREQGNQSDTLEKRDQAIITEITELEETIKDAKKARAIEVEKLDEVVKDTKKRK